MAAGQHGGVARRHGRVDCQGGRAGQGRRLAQGLQVSDERPGSRCGCDCRRVWSYCRSRARDVVIEAATSRPAQVSSDMTVMQSSIPMYDTKNRIFLFNWYSSLVVYIVVYIVVNMSFD